MPGCWFPSPNSGIPLVNVAGPGGFDYFSAMYRLQKLLFGLLFCIFLTGLLPGCATVEEYGKARLNDADMQSGNRLLEEFESNFQSYREGAVGGQNGNSGAGCGCN